MFCDLIRVNLWIIYILYDYTLWKAQKNLFIFLLVNLIRQFMRMLLFSSVTSLARDLYFMAPGSFLRLGPWSPAPAPATKFVFVCPGPQFVFTSHAPQFVFTGPDPQFVFTGSDPQFLFTPNLYYPAQPGLSLHIPTFSFQFVLTGPGLWFVRTQAAKLIYPQWCWIM